jgi:HEAT repeat protein
LELPGVTDMSPALAVVVVFTAAMFVVATCFLVAAGRLRRANDRKAAIWSSLEASLDLTIERIAAGTEDAAALHERIRPAEQVILLDYLYKTTIGETRATRRALYHELARPYLGLLERRARTGDTWQRARAIRTLAALAGRDSGGVVIEALDDPAPHVGMTAARVYAQLGIGAVDPLLDRIERYLNWDRRLLRSVLVSFGLPAAPSLHARLADDSASPAVRAVCADALATLAYEGAGATAAAVLEVAQDVDLIAACLRLLRSPGTPEQRAIVRRLCQVEDDVVRGQAVACLARFGENADLAVVERALSDLSPWVVRSAARGLSARATGSAEALQAAVGGRL